MTVDEIFSQIASHMVEGLMTHAQLADYYNFLGLKGYEKCHECHYFHENVNFRKITKYYLDHYHKLVKETPFKNTNIISQDWYQYTKFKVDLQVRKSSIEYGFEKWVSWEQETKTLYEKYYLELMQLNEVAAALEVKKYIKDVDKELAEAQHSHLCAKAINFNISDIMDKQDDLYWKYKKEMEEIKLC